MNVTLSQASTLIRTVGQTNTFLLRGQPGIGKTSVLYGLQEHFPDHFIAYIDAACLDLGDFAMPVVDKEELITEYAPNARFGVGRNQSKPICMMIDEVGKASRPVLNMLLPLLLERRIGDLYLPAGSFVFATTNLDTDGVGDNIPAHAFNRMTVLDVANPTADEWLGWAANHGVAPEVMAFARDYPQVFERYDLIDPKEKNPYIFSPLTGNTKAFCSPRSLEKASNIIKQRDVLGDSMLAALCGTVGEAAARDLEANVMLADSMPRFAAIVADPVKCKMPDGAGAYFLMALSLAARAKADNLDAIMKYINRFESFEASTLFVTTVASNASKVAFASKCTAFTIKAAAVGKFF
jgi:hypothetical protein